MVKILREKDVQASMFLTGKWTEENPELARQKMLVHLTLVEEKMTELLQSQPR